MNAVTGGGHPLSGGRPEPLVGPSTPSGVSSSPPCIESGDGKVDCPSCGRRLKPRRYGHLPAHYADPADGLRKPWPGYCQGASGQPVVEGHRFHFSVATQAEGANWVSEPFRLTVRAWSLTEACTRARRRPAGRLDPARGRR